MAGEQMIGAEEDDVQFMRTVIHLSISIFSLSNHILLSRKIIYV